MIIQIKKFGTTLTSRDSGREAYSRLKIILKDIRQDEELILDFSGIDTFTPSWADEFITKLFEEYRNKKVLINIDNPSVKATLELLSDVTNFDFLK
jgi:hypothetical protein